MTTGLRLRRRLRRCLPWSDGSGRPWPGWLRAAPFCTIYLIASWAIFLPQARRVPGNWVIDTERVRPWLYDIPNLSQHFFRALLSLTTGPWLNHNAVQLVYVTLLFFLVAFRFEAKEGTLRTIAIFFATTFAGAVAAGILLHLLYPEFWSTPMAEKAWNRPWSGGSAGAFGLMGATAARAPVPWPLLAIFVLWEANVVYWYLHEYTPAFHISALFAGYLLTRYLLPARRASPARTAPGVSTQRRSSVCGSGAPRQRGVESDRLTAIAAREQMEARAMHFATADNRSSATAGDARSTDDDARDPAEGEVPGTGIMGDETLVRDTDGEPGIYPAPPAPTGGEAHPGPAKEEPSE